MPKEPTPAEKIKSLRSTLGMNQEAFAKEVEVDQSVISDWEQGKYRPSVESYSKLMSLAAKHELREEAVWFMTQVSATLLELVSALVKERDAAYTQALGQAQTLYPNDALAQHRFATAQADRVMRMRASKKP